MLYVINLFANMQISNIVLREKCIRMESFCRVEIRLYDASCLRCDRISRENKCRLSYFDESGECESCICFHKDALISEKLQIDKLNLFERGVNMKSES
jgi:hypothetical protein